MINVKDCAYGALGDGAIVSGVLTGTNDTAAINLAIAACGDGQTLYFPDGMYIITPGGLSTIRCSVYGPGAIFIGSCSDGNNFLFNVSYDETYPVALGTGNTGLHAWKTFKVHQIIGNPNGDGDKSNTAIHFDHLNESQVFVDVIRGCSRGLHLDGSAYDTHQGTNEINIGHLYMCDVGVLMQGGNAGNMCEANRITGRYWYGFTTAAISMMGGGDAVRCDNVFDIISLCAGIENGNGIMLDSLCRRNEFHVRSWDSGVSGTGKHIISSGSNNLFKIPLLDMSRVDAFGSDIFDTQTSLTDGNGRSNISAQTPPASGHWIAGSKCWKPYPPRGGSPGWIRATGDTWEAMPALSGSPKLKATRSGAQLIPANTDTVAVFNTVLIDQTTAYNHANGVFQPDVAGYYQVSAQLVMSGVGMSLVGIVLLKNGAVDTPLQTLDTSLSGVVVGGSTLVYLNGTTDTIAIRGYIGAASGASFSGGTFSAVLDQAT